MASARPDWRSIQIGCRGVTLAVGHAPSGAVLGASTAMALHSLCVIPQLVGAMILTSNRGFAEWGDVFGDPVVATACSIGCSTTPS
jgi:hypothetical protein